MHLCVGTDIQQTLIAQGLNKQTNESKDSSLNQYCFRIACFLCTIRHIHKQRTRRGALRNVNNSKYVMSIFLIYLFFYFLWHSEYRTCLYSLTTAALNPVVDVDVTLLR